MLELELQLDSLIPCKSDFVKLLELILFQTLATTSRLNQIWILALS